MIFEKLWQTQFSILFSCLHSFKRLLRWLCVQSWFAAHDMDRVQLATLQWIPFFTIRKQELLSSIESSLYVRKIGGNLSWTQLRAALWGAPMRQRLMSHTESSIAATKQTSSMMTEDIYFFHRYIRCESNKIQCLLIASSCLSTYGSAIKWAPTSTTHRRRELLSDVNESCILLLWIFIISTAISRRFLSNWRLVVCFTTVSISFTQFPRLKFDSCWHDV